MSYGLCRDRLFFSGKVKKNCIDGLQYSMIEENADQEDMGMWAYESVFYQIYPLGFCGW